MGSVNSLVGISLSTGLSNGETCPKNYQSMRIAGESSVSRFWKGYSF
jgi:hypothetical protein